MMNSELTILFQFGVGLFSILNPIGGIPLFLSLTSHFSPLEKRKLINLTTLTCFIAITISLVLGQKILNFFGISIMSFRLGGGILIGSMALKMLSAKGTAPAKINQEEVNLLQSKRMEQIKELAVVPIGIPLFVGPGTFSTCIIYAEKLEHFTLYIGTILTVLIICLLLRFCLIFSTPIEKKMGRVGLNVMSRIMGLILLAISVEMISFSLKQLFPILAQV